jgi:hypothetical protein
MAAALKFHQYVEDLAEKVHNLGADTLKVALSNTAPVATNSILANITQITAANGYSAGGSQSVQSSSAQTSGVYKLVLADVTYSAAGGSIGPFRYPVLYNDTPTSPADPLIQYWDYGASVTLTDGNSFTVDFSATNGVLTLT